MCILMTDDACYTSAAQRERLNASMAVCVRAQRRPSALALRRSPLEQSTNHSSIYGGGTRPDAGRVKPTTMIRRSSNIDSMNGPATRADAAGRWPSPAMSHSYAGAPD